MKTCKNLFQWVIKNLSTTTPHPWLALAITASLAMATAHAATLQKVAVGAQHTVLIQSDGALWAWGNNDNGQLGNGSRRVANRPQRVGDGFVQVSAANNYSLAIQTDGSLWGWGDNTDGQLGNGTTVGSLTPAPLGTGFAQVSAGERHVAAVKTDGSLWTWGFNDNAQLGDGTVLPSLRPVKVGDGFTMAAAGGYHTLAIKADGSLWAWGGNYNGQLGTGSTIGSKLPVQVGTGTDFVRVSAGINASLAIKRDGSLWFWGYGDYFSGNAPAPGQGLFAAPSALSPLLVASNIARATIHAGFIHAVAQDGRLLDWGSASSNPGSDFVPVVLGEAYAQVETSATHGVALKRDGTVWAWGDNQLGQLGIGETNIAFEPVTIGTGYRQATVADSHTLAIKADTSLWGWGNNSFGQLGTGTMQNAFSPVLIGTGYTQVATNVGHTMALKTDGSLWAWGDNSYGQLGDGGTTRSLSPKLIGTGFTQIAVGAWHSLAIAADGSLLAAGVNHNGQLGTGQVDTALTANGPVWVGKGFAKVAALNDFTLAIKSDGTLWVWGGINSAPMLGGNGNLPRSPTPLQIDKDAALVTGYFQHAEVIKTDGSLWSWTGFSFFSVGEPFPNGSGFASVSPGHLHWLGIKPDGSLWANGVNGTGQLGTGNLLDVYPTVQIGTDFAQVAAGPGHTVAIKKDGTLLGWGASNVGQLAQPAVTQAMPRTLQQVLLPVVASAVNGQITVAGPPVNVVLRATLTPEPVHTLGQKFFIAILPDGRVFTHTLAGWVLLDAVQRQGYGAGLQAVQLDMPVGAVTPDMKGTLIYLGYGLGATATESWDEMLLSRRFKVGATLQ